MFIQLNMKLTANGDHGATQDVYQIVVPIEIVQNIVQLKSQPKMEGKAALVMKEHSNNAMIVHVKVIYYND